MTEPTPTHAYMTRQKKRGSGNLGTFKQILQLVCLKLERIYVSLFLFLSLFLLFFFTRNALSCTRCSRLTSCLVLSPYVMRG